MSLTLVLDEQTEIPLSMETLEDFRSWARSQAFPERGRIDFIGGRIEVDMSPEDLFTHGSVKTEIVSVLGVRVKRRRLGRLFSDRTRISCPKADLSVEPDVVFVSQEAITGGKVRLVPMSGSNKRDRFAEIEGGPELTVEIISDSSIGKDQERLPAAYSLAGVQEYWLVDARREDLVFQIHRRGATGFEPVTPDAEGFQHSAVFDCDFRLDRTRGEDGFWAYDLIERE